MVGTRLQAGTSTVVFTFDPLDYRVGALLSGLGIVIVILILLKGKETDGYVSRVLPPADTSNKKRKRK
jgi:hypothetical protein